MKKIFLIVGGIIFIAIAGRAIWAWQQVKNDEAGVANTPALVVTPTPEPAQTNTNTQTPPVASATSSNLVLLTPAGAASYKIGDTIHISWAPSSPGVQNIKFILANKTGGLYGGGGYDSPIYTGYNFGGRMSGGSPLITNGYYNYTLRKGVLLPGSYYVEINYLVYDSLGKVMASSTAMSKVPLTITN